MSELTTAVLLAAATLVSEDAACFTAAALVQQGQVSAWSATIGCVTGIYLGDLGLWALGRMAATTTRGRRWLARVVPASVLGQARRSFHRVGPFAVIASRFLPGTRTALYLAAGLIGTPLPAFALWTLIAVAAWVPTIVLTGATVADVLQSHLRLHWVGVAAAGLVVIAIARWLAARGHLRERVTATISRMWRWEFWPSWVFYAPLAPYLAWLAIRFGLRSLSAANPALPGGGVVGESKFAILARLPSPWVLPSIQLDPGAVATRVSRLCAWMLHEQVDFPIVLKPDVGQRGVGVRRVSSLDEAHAYLASAPAAVVAQRWHPGPGEAGVFYLRRPGEARGRVIGLTDKRFPEVVGDGTRTLEDLVWAHSRFRMQARTFLQRHDAERRRVLRHGERFRLGQVGNHAQGTEFRDGWHRVTPALERRVDDIARQCPGFYIGRFDVRYSDPGAFSAGEDFAIVELNGATAELTNLYDPAFSLLRAYRLLFWQWRLVFEVGAANRRAGHRPDSLLDLARLVIVHLTASPRLPLAD